MTHMGQHHIDAAAGLCARMFGRASADAARLRWRDRIAYLRAIDPDGSFVSESDGGVCGVAQALRREGLWRLSVIAVDPELQSRGLGRALFRAALDHYSDSEAGLIVSSNDPRALRLYASSGFSLWPALQAQGRVDRSKLPAADPDISLSDTGDLSDLDGLARSIRGAGYGCELQYALERGAQLVRITDQGFAVAEPGVGVSMLVAANDTTASGVLAAALHVATDAERPVRWIPGLQNWAVRVVLQAGLEVSAYGALAVRGDPGPLRPFLPSEPFA